jgi:putative endonuclease
MVTAKAYWVYILANTGGRAATIYTGMTNDLERRVAEHRSPERDGRQHQFTTRYRTVRLVYVEEYPDVRDAIVREKQIKGWRRDRKLALIESQNPAWRDLSVGWSDPS